jgi:hypothetical protein
MSIADRIRLSFMMFLNYVIWGSWYVTLGAYLTIHLKFTGIEAGLVFGTSSIACMVSPFFVGLIRRIVSLLRSGFSPLYTCSAPCFCFSLPGPPVSRQSMA